MESVAIFQIQFSMVFKMLSPIKKKWCLNCYHIDPTIIVHFGKRLCSSCEFIVDCDGLFVEISDLELCLNHKD